jgi:hypothetical protein
VIHTIALRSVTGEVGPAFLRTHVGHSDGLLFETASKHGPDRARSTGGDPGGQLAGRALGGDVAAGGNDTDRSFVNAGIKATAARTTSSWMLSTWSRLAGLGPTRSAGEVVRTGCGSVILS